MQNGYMCITQCGLIHKVQLGVEGGQVRVLLQDDRGDEVQQGLGTVCWLGLQQLSGRGGGKPNVRRRR